jgi:hypothetical protein
MINKIDFAARNLTSNAGLFLCISEFRQQIKTFRLKYMFFAAKIIRTARYVVMKLPAKYPYIDVYERCLA